MNKVILTGNLCKDLELKQSMGGKSVITNTIAVQREYKSANGEYESDFINIVVWDKQAEYLSKYGHKGNRVELCGRWTVRKYQANDGTNRIVNECVVESIKVFSKPKEEQKPTQYGYNPYAENNTQYEEIPNDTGFPF
jgi:single-strand DNA-binding protein